MRPLDQNYRLNGMSLREIARDFGQACLDVQDEFTVDGRRVKAGHVINALVLHFLAQPPAKRRAMIREGLDELQRLRELDEPEPPKTGFEPRKRFVPPK